MLNTVTWESFIYGGALLVGGYYAIASLLLYNQEIIAWFKPKPLAFTAHQQSDVPPPEGHTSIIGPTTVEEEWQHKRTSVLGAEEIIVAEEVHEEMPETILPPGKSDFINGSVSDLMQEIKALLQMAAEYKSAKEEVVSLFIALFERYPQLKNSAYAQAINRHVFEEGKTKFAFVIHLIEVQSWWESSITA